jgi:tetratricopeptide (TPR) repeat protein
VKEAVEYLRRAGEQAAAQFANGDAVAFYNRALALIPKDPAGEWLMDRYALLLAREKVHFLRGEREAQQADLAELAQLAQALGDDRQRAVLALRQSLFAEAIGDYPAAVAAARGTIDLARAAQAPSVVAAGHREWGVVLWRQGAYEAALPQLEEAVRIFRQIGDRRGESESLSRLGDVSWTQGDYVAAKAYCEESLRICRESDDRRGEAEAFNRLGNVSREQGDYSGAGTYFEQTLRVCREIGDRRREGMALGNLGVLFDEEGHYAEAREYFEQALRVFREIGDRVSECGTLANLGLLLHHVGDEEDARQYNQQALDVAREIGTRRWEAYALTNLGHALVGLERLSEAADVYEQGLAVRRELGQHNLAMEPLAGLARVSLARGDTGKAQAHVEEILLHLEDNTVEGADEPFRVFLTCYRVLHANQDPRAGAILEKAHGLLQEWAARIADDELRRSFLENVAAHREIVTIWRSSTGGE